MPSEAPALSSEEIERRVLELGEWFHNLDLRGISTAPQHFLGDFPRLKWRQFETALPADLKGASVLDIGCNGGFYSFEMKRRGAGRVLGIDFDNRYLAQARFAAEVNGLDIEFRQLSVYDLAQLRETFDIVLFMGVFYHLRHPLLALDLIHEHVTRDLLVFQSLQRGSNSSCDLLEDYPFWEEEIFEQSEFPKMFFIERRFSHDPTNWWIPNKSCVQAMLRSSGFEILANPENEVFICKRVVTPSLENL